MPNNAAIQNLFATVSLGAPEKAVGFVLWRVLHSYLREVDQALRGLDLTHLQFMTLVLVAWLSRSGEPVMQTGLAEFGNIHPMQVSHMLKTLENKGMVARAHMRTDTRSKCVEVTTAGLRALRSALPLVIGVQRRVFGDEGKAGGDLLAMLLRIETRR